jgi:hypothetical protein
MERFPDVRPTSCGVHRPEAKRLYLRKQDNCVVSMSLTLPFDSDVRIAQVWKSPDFALSCRSRSARRFESSTIRELQQETIADPEEVSSFERWRQNRLRDYLASRKPVPRDPRDGLPILPEDTASTLATRYGASTERLAQALALESFGLRSKARRLVLCGRLGHRINHQRSQGACHRKFVELHFCREKYCVFCGPQQFRELFAKLQNALVPVAEQLVCDGARSGRQMVTAKLDFTVRNDGHMPTPQEVRQFHADMRRFWRAAERKFGIKRSEYGVVRCDELGGDNTNLHCHCAYVGPWLPQKNKELSNLWSQIRGEQAFVSIKPAKTFAGALAHALKYPAKFLDKSTPERLAALERTFHKTRRVSTGGAFYRINDLREPGSDRELEHAFCPFCNVRLVVVREQWQPLFILEEEGRISLRTAEREAGQARVFSGAGPP